MILGVGVTFHHQSHIPLLRAGRSRQQTILSSPSSPTHDEQKNVATFPPSSVARGRAVSCAPSLIPRHARLPVTGIRHAGYVLLNTIHPAYSIFLIYDICNMYIL